MSCQRLGNLKSLTFSQYAEYKYAIGIYLKVEAFNSNVSTLRDTGNTGIPYYNFVSYKEENSYTLGQMLLIQTNPTTTFTPVQKN